MKCLGQDLGRKFDAIYSDALFGEFATGSPWLVINCTNGSVVFC
jgi:hypothetical protein